MLAPANLKRTRAAVNLSRGLLPHRSRQRRNRSRSHRPNRLSGRSLRLLSFLHLPTKKLNVRRRRIAWTSIRSKTTTFSKVSLELPTIALLKRTLDKRIKPRLQSTVRIQHQSLANCPNLESLRSCPGPTGYLPQHQKLSLRLPENTLPLPKTVHWNVCREHKAPLERILGPSLVRSSSGPPRRIVTSCKACALV